MTWRRFLTLLSGLSAESRWHLAFRSDRKKRRIDDPAAAERYFASIG